MQFIHGLEEQLWSFLETLYHTVGWFGVVVMMAIESACIPLPSEIIMPLAGGYLVKGPLDLIIAGFAGAIGCTLGSALAYWVGALGGRPLIEKYGKYILLNKHHLDTADRWFNRWGEATAFFSRLLPVVRTFISFPAGVARMNFPKFLIYTFLGSFPWSLALAWAGWTWPPRAVREAMRPFDIPIIAVILLLVAVFVIIRIRNRKNDVVTTTPTTGGSRGSVAARRPAANPEVRVTVKPANPNAPARRRSSRGYQPPSQNGRTPPADQ
ncbi:MAG: DedA family protein [Chloroflexota bacterium]|nr:DedA family protein [Chloroflexota bacterium]